MSLREDYLRGVEILGAAAPQYVFTSVNEYPLYDPRLDRDMDMDALVSEIEAVLGLDAPTNLWPRGNVVWPGVELEEALATLPADWEYAIGGIVPPGPTLWEGSTEDLYSRIDWERSFDENFDDVTVRRTGKMRGG